MAAPKQSLQFPSILNFIVSAIFWAVFGPLGSIYFLTITILTLPYTFYFWSSNFGIQKRDCAIIQCYLDQFETLHPELALALQHAFESHRHAFGSYRLGEGVTTSRFWPTNQGAQLEKGSNIKSASINGQSFSLGAGLFMQLEEAGFSRQILMQFLMDHVESEIKMDQEEKIEYRRVMEKLCGHRLSDLLDISGAYTPVKNLTNGEGFMTPGKSVTGITPFLLRSDRRMDWVLQPHAIIVPMDWETHAKAEKMVKFGLWKAVKTDTDLESKAHDTCWQLVDLR